MRKGKGNIDLLEQCAIGNAKSDVLALESGNDHCGTEGPIGLFKVAIQALEIAFWRDELKKIAAEM